MDFGLRGGQHAYRPYAASLPICVPTVEGLFPASFSFPSRLAVRLHLALPYGYLHRSRQDRFILLESAHAGHTGVSRQAWCAGETSRKSRMKESYREGLASHPDPESCGAGREAGREAETGAQAGRAIELRKRLLSSADAVKVCGRPHGRVRHRQSASGSAESKNLRACLETSCTGTRRSRRRRRREKPPAGKGKR